MKFDVLVSRIKYQLQQSNTSGIFLKNVLRAFCFKVLYVFATFLVVRLALDKMGASDYGLLLTITTFANWFVLIDFGYASSLRNKLNALLLAQKHKYGSILLSSVYGFYLLIFGGTFILFSGLCWLINWQSIFHVGAGKQTEVVISVILIAFGVSARAILNLLNAVLHATEKSSHIELLNFLSQLIILLFLAFSRNISLVSYAACTALSFTLVYSAFSLYFYKYRTPLRPAGKYVSFSALKALKSSRIHFFLIQLNALILYSTDNFLISYWFDTESTAKYNIVFKYFNLITLIWSIVLTPYWSSVTKEYHLGNIDWIKKSSKRLVYMWMVLGVASFVMILLSSFVYRMWLKSSIDIPFSLSLIIGVYVVIAAFTSIYSNILNGVGVIRIQAIAVMPVAILNIVLAYILGVRMGLGYIGIPLATVVSQLLIAVICYIEYSNKITKC